MREAPTTAQLALLDPDGRFSQRLADDHAAFMVLAGSLERVDDDGALADMQRLAHRLAGAAGTFGHPAVSEAALDLEESLISLREGEEDSKATARRLVALLAALEAALRLK